jgi:hypothetical protein
VVIATVKELPRHPTLRNAPPGWIAVVGVTVIKARPYRLGVRTEDSQSFSGSATTPTALILLKVSFGSLWVTLREWVKNG